MWESELALCRWQNSVPFRTCHRILRTVFSSRPLGHFSSSSRTVWSTNSNTRYSLFFLRNTSIRFTRWSCRSCCNRIEKLCSSFYSSAYQRYQNCFNFKLIKYRYSLIHLNIHIFAKKYSHGIMFAEISWLQIW